MGGVTENGFPVIESTSRWSRSMDRSYRESVNRAVRGAGGGRLELLFDRSSAEWVVCRWQSYTTDLGGAKGWAQRPHPYIRFGKTDTGRPARPGSSQVSRALSDAMDVSYRRKAGAAEKFVEQREVEEKKEYDDAFNQWRDETHDSMAGEIHKTTGRELFGSGTVSP